MVINGVEVVMPAGSEEEVGVRCVGIFAMLATAEAARGEGTSQPAPEPEAELMTEPA